MYHLFNSSPKYKISNLWYPISLVFVSSFLTHQICKKFALNWNGVVRNGPILQRHNRKRWNPVLVSGLTSGCCKVRVLPGSSDPFLASPSIFHTTQGRPRSRRYRCVIAWPSVDSPECRPVRHFVPKRQTIAAGAEAEAIRGAGRRDRHSGLVGPACLSPRSCRCLSFLLA